MELYRIDNALTVKINNIDIKISDFLIQEIDKSYPAHFHSETSYEIHYYKSCEGYMIINNKKYEIKPNTAIYTGPLVVHEQIITKPGIKYSIYLNIDDIECSELIKEFSKYDVIYDISNTYILAFEAMKNELIYKKFGYKELLSTYILSLFTNLLRTVYKKDNNIIPNDKDLSFEIEEILLNESATITIEELADRLFISVRALQRYLQANYKKTFSKLRQEYRLAYSEYLIKNTNMSIADIANKIGYQSTMHFIQAFKEKFNVTPLKYRKSSVVDTNYL